jgi:prolyl oligopeptidase
MFQFKRVPSGEPLVDQLKDLKFTSVDFTHDGTGLFYAVRLYWRGPHIYLSLQKYPPQSSVTARHAGVRGDGTQTDKQVMHTLYYHRLGDVQEHDVIVAQFPDQPEWMV